MDSPRGRLSPSPEAGFALIEVLISGVIAIIAATGIMALMQSSIHTANDQRNKSESYALAQEDQTRMRGMSISSLKNYTLTREVPIDNTTFTIESSAKFTNNTTGGDLSCANGGSTVDYVKVASKVTWPGMGPIAPTEIHNIIAPPNGSLNPAAGTLVFIATNASGAPLSGIGLTGTGAGTFSGTTNASGCAIFLEQAAGEYTLTTSGTAVGVVDADGNTPAPKKIKVSARGTNTVNLNYDLPGSVPLKLQTTKYSGATVTDKTNEFLIAYNTGMTTAKSFGTAGTKMSTGEFKATPLFPFSSKDVFYAGACTTNNPIEGGAIASVLVPANGTAATQTITLPSLQPTIKKMETAANKKSESEMIFSGAAVKVTDTECEVSGSKVSRSLGLTNASGQVEEKELGLPWSTYEVCASGSVTTGLESNKNTKVRHQIETIAVHSPVNALTIKIEANSPEGACP